MITWKKFLEQKNYKNKKLILMRGVSGSGKSTRAREITSEQGGVIFSTDDFFYVGGKYQFNPDLIRDAHLWNQERTEKAMQQGISPIIIDNTNIKLWEMKPYVKLAKKYNYEVEIEEPRTEIWTKAKEINKLVQELSRILSELNKHGVPPHVIATMIANYEKIENIDDILNS